MAQVPLQKSAKILTNGHFYNVTLSFKKLDKIVDNYTLKYLGCHHQISEHANDKSINGKATKSLIEPTIKLKFSACCKLSTRILPTFQFNGTTVDELRPFYNSKHNLGDVAVWTDETNLVNFVK